MFPGVSDGSTTALIRDGKSEVQGRKPRSGIRIKSKDSDR
jgi:hypothetical protein